MSNKIPKVINYCWFGGNEMPEKAKKCIDSWKKFCPDYEIKEWNETNFDIKKYKFVEDAYNAKKWAFVTDVARLDIIYNNGGLYFDTDVEIVKNFDDLLEFEMFMGFENPNYVNTGLGFGAKKGNEIIKENLEEYKKIKFPVDGKIGNVTCPIITSRILEARGFKMNGKYQNIDENVLYPIDYFCPLDYDTNKLNKTNNTYSIHWFSASWLTKKDKIKHCLKKYIKLIIKK